MKFKGWLRIAMFFLAGAVVIVGAAAVVGYVWYTHPEVINNLLYTTTPGAITRNPYAAMSVAGKSASVLTSTNSFEDEPEGTPFAYLTVESTSTSTPTITSTLSETPTVTLTETATNTQPYTTTTSPVNTAIPYSPANTKVSYPTATKTQAPYYPPPTKTFTPTTQIIPPTATKTPTPTTSDPQSPPPTNTDTPTPTNTATFTAAPPENADPPPTSTFTPTATTSGPAPTPTIDISGCSYANHGSYENELLGLINDLRNAHGLGNLNMQYQLVGAAKEHSNDMACNNFVSHTGSNGTSNHDRILAYGYSYSWRGENIYMGWNTTPQEAFNWWINSEPHLNNLLGSAYIHIGIGHTVVGSRNAYTLVFGRP